MKTCFAFILSLLMVTGAFAQSPKKNAVHSGSKKQFWGNTEKRIRDSFVFRPEKESSFSFSSFFQSCPVRPEASVDLYDGKGIHLFSVSGISMLPPISVGARFNAGLIITL
jgi:hypothetical protein